MKQNFLNQKKHRPFTLIEVLCVIVIIGILSGISYGVYGYARTRGKTTATQALIASIESSLGQYYDKYGYYPSTLEGTTFVYRPLFTDWFSDEKNADDALQPKNNLSGLLDLETVKKFGTEEKSGDMIRYKVRDAFGGAVYYRCPGKFNKNTYDLGSAAADGKFGDKVSAEQSFTQKDMEDNFGKGDDIANFKR